MYLINGKVIIQPARDNDEIILSSGHKLYVPLVYKFTETDRPVITECVVGKVIHSPSIVDWQNQQWVDDSIQIQDGDTVMFHFLKSRDKEYHDKEKQQIVIHYCDIFVVIRDGEIIPINGWILCRPIEEKTVSQYLHLPTVRKRYSQKVQVKHVSKPTKRYTATQQGVEYYVRDTDVEEINPGDYVWVEKNSDVMVDNDIEKILGEPLFRIQRRQILGIDESL